jgi:hypothetical protein
MLRVGIPIPWLSAGSCERVIGETGPVGGGKMGRAEAFSGRLRLLGKDVLVEQRIVTRGVLSFF